MTHKRKKMMLQAGVALLLILIGVVSFLLLKSSRKSLGHQQPPPPLPLVRTVPVEIGTVDMSITGEGTVQPVTESRIVPQISGKVVGVSKNLVNGGTFQEGERLLTIEPEDYEIAVTLAEAAVKDAESQYETARQESQAARGEWRRVHPDREPPPLVAQKPQLTAARANLKAKRANLKQARLNLERTRITAPFNGRVSSEQVDIGQYVTPGQELATVYATNALEIPVPLEDDDLHWLAIPDFNTDRKKGAAATVRARVAGRKKTWPGRVDRIEGEINNQTRLVKVVIRVSRPCAARPPLIPGQFVKVAIDGRSLEKAAVIPRAALHGADTVWAVDPAKNRLYFRTVEIARMDERGVVIRGGLKKSDRVVVSPVKEVTDGMKVKPVMSGKAKSS